MITAGRHHEHQVVRTPPVLATPEPHRSGGLALCLELLTCGIFLAAAGAGCFPLIWGLALHQAPLAASGACFVAMGAIALLNRICAPPAARHRPAPCLAALTARPWVLLLCLSLMGAAVVTLVTWWP
jgi:hypothetical protein